MPTLRERFVKRFMGPELFQLSEVQQRLYSAYLQGPYELPPETLLKQLQEYDPALVADLITQMGWEVIGGYGGTNEGERGRAVADSRRMFKYSIIARWIVNLWTYYGLGEDVTIVCQDDAAQEAWAEFWTADRNQVVVAKDRLDDLSRWLLVSGERFLIFFASDQDGEATVRAVQAEQITNVYCNPDDNQDPWFYERRWTPPGGTMSKTSYYADWQTFFSDVNGDKMADRWAIVQKQYPTITGNLEDNDHTATCILFAPFLQLDEDSIRGWPLLAPHGTPWIRAQREFMQDRATVARGKAALIRRYTVAGGSRAVDSIRRTLGSAFQFGGVTETNPPPAAGSSEVVNKAVGVEELPLSTGASDAKTDGEMFSWMAGLAGGVFPHYMGLGDAYRLATATAMETPIRMQFSLYRNQLSALFRKVVRVVLMFQERYNGKDYDSYEAEVSTDRLVEVDLALVGTAIASLYRDVLATASVPDDARDKVTVFALQTYLDALGATDVDELVNEKMFVKAAKEAKKKAAAAPPPPVAVAVPVAPAPPTEPVVVEGEQMEEQVNDSGKVVPKGKPLKPWGTDPVPITAEDVARAIRDWDARMPEEAKGILMAVPQRVATTVEDSGG
jgi:hypothetical protein